SRSSPPTPPPRSTPRGARSSSRSPSAHLPSSSDPPPPPPPRAASPSRCPTPSRSPSPSATRAAAPPPPPVWSASSPTTTRPTSAVPDRFLAVSSTSASLDLRTPPAFPQGVQLSVASSPCAVHLAWSPASAPSGPVTYVVYRSLPDDPKSDWQQIASLASTTF